MGVAVHRPGAVSPIPRPATNSRTVGSAPDLDPERPVYPLRGSHATVGVAYRTASVAPHTTAGPGIAHLPAGDTVPGQHFDEENEMAHKKNTAFRTTGYDVLPPPPKAKAKPEPFNIDANRVPVLDHLHRVRGHTGKLATEAGLSHFGLKHGGSLQTVKGRDCWVGNSGVRP
jgi:hypothetical protein